jgi:hypothetical protein
VSNSLSVVLASPLPAVSPSSLKFPVQLVGRSGAPQNVTLTNGGSAILNISGISTAGDFRQTNDCASALIGGADCSISVTFKPAGKNVRTGTLTIAEAGSSQTVSLSGTGTFVNLQPRNLNFGNVQVGQSATVPVTLQNTANVALNIASITITGDPTDFSQTNNCGTQIGAHASCTISVTFTPLSTGAKSASLSISDNGGGSPQKVALKGTGI